MTQDTSIKSLAAKHGVENLRVFFLARPLHLFPMGLAFTQSDDEPVVVEGRIDESVYKVADGHKITVRPLDDQYAYETYYQCDFEGLCEELPDDFRVEIA